MHELSLQPGEVVDGKYTIVRLIGEGGMGAVYEGENTRIHRRVAIKVLHGHVATNTQAVTRFEREAQAAGRIGSEHIVEVLDLGSLANGDRYMVMEFLEGESLSDRIRARGRLSMEEAFYLLRQVLEGLAAAHSAEIVHRDLKPDNVFVLKGRRGQRDFVKLLDFGISKFNKLGDSAFSMTSTGAVLGTPYYMSPEQARGKGIDQRTDVYSTGVILYECVTGAIPFQAETFNELMFKIGLEEPPPVKSLNPEVDDEFAAIIKKAMIRDANERFATALEFQQALDDWAQNHGISAPRSRPAPPATQPSQAMQTAQPTQPSGPGPNAPTAAGVNALTPALQADTGGVWSQTGAAQAKSGNGRVLIIAAAVGLVAVLGIGGVIAAVSSKNKSAAAADDTSAATPPPPTTTEAKVETPSTPEPKETATEKPTASAEPSATTETPKAPSTKTQTVAKTADPKTIKTADPKTVKTADPKTTTTTSTSGRKIRDDI
jgi:eukaryotic-like serine/threonine-protein kinase